MDKNITFINTLKNILRNDLYKFLLIGSVLIALLIPVIAQKFVLPSFYEQLLFNTIDDAKRVGKYIEHQQHNKDEKKIQNIVTQLKEDFNAIKIKIFDKNGIVTFSTDPKDIGSKNQHEYFYNNVAKGEMFYKVVTKGETNLEGDTKLTKDVAEIYVPFMINNIFQGSSEIYYDITDKKNSFEKLVYKILLLYYLFAIFFLIFILIMIYNVSKADLKEYLREKEIVELNESLKEKVNEKTKELKDINENLKIRVQEEVEQNRQKDKILYEQSKMAALGEMINNIAHQWRQPLSVISTGATAIKLKKEYDILTDDYIMETCDKIDENAQYLSKTIDDFSNFIKGDSQPVKFNLKNDTVSFLRLIDSTISNHNIKVILDLHENIKVQGYPNELIQCFINIFNNSKDALIKNNKDDDRYIFISEINEEKEVKIIFKDNAGGIPEDILPKIFEPYFTTKHQSQGTGLGLSMSYNLIVNSMNGSLEATNIEYEFNSKHYKGAQFSIIIPVAK